MDPVINDSLVPISEVCLQDSSLFSHQLCHMKVECSPGSRRDGLGPLGIAHTQFQYSYFLRGGLHSLSLSLSLLLANDTELQFLQFCKIIGFDCLKFTSHSKDSLRMMLRFGSVPLPVTVSKQLSLFLDQASTNHHHPLLQVIIR